MSRAMPMMYVADVSKTVRFYEEALGATCDHAHDDGSYAELRLGSLELALVDADYARRHFPGEFRQHDPSGPPDAFEFYVEVEDVNEALARALDAGAAQLSQPTKQPWGQENAFLRDPDGIVIELASSPDKSPPESQG